MPFIEAPTTFYLGRRYDPATQRLTDDVVYYDSRDLTTHAVVVGMTGSGKTGLCITLLEEAILDNIPAIIIDPKGDITNLLLDFPDLRPEDFQPWVNVDDARRAGMDVNAFAADQAQRWRDGLASWSIVPDRMRWLKAAAKCSIYTPGSDTGLPISILASLRAPREGWAGREEMHREKISGIVTALLALIGLNVQPVKDKEHVLVANIFEYAWSRGQDLTLEDIILQVQKPPFNKLGVFPIDDYMSEKSRYKLAMDLNNIIASPSFQSWTTGEPMDIQNLLYQPDGRPRISIFYIAHLTEAERQFIITLLLENMLGWMQTLSGTTSLRALLYIDEMFGYFPPYPLNPPTKNPILRLLKQARAFGLGLILATQNPGDLDYKGLSNAGTWFIGRLQSENDKERVMAGLQSMATALDDMSVKDLGQLVSDIAPRVFVMRNVHDTGGPIMIHSRWTMSYLRGPLTRQQVQWLMADQRQQLLNRAYAAAAVGGAPNYYAAQAAVAQSRSIAPPSPPVYAPPPVSAPPGVAQPPSFLPEAAPPNLPEFPTQTAPPPPVINDSFPVGSSQATVPPGQVPRSPGGTQATTPGVQAPTGFSVNQPPVPASTPQYFLPTGITSQQALDDWEKRTNFAATGFGGMSLAYKPVLLAQASVRYQDRKTQLYTAVNHAYAIPGLERAGIVHWEEYQTEAIELKRLSGEPFSAGFFGDLSPGLTDAKRLAALKRELVDVIYNTASLKVPYNPELDIYGTPGGNFSEFRAQVQQVAHEKRDAEVDALTKKYEAIMDKLEEDLKKKSTKLSADKQNLADRRREEMFTTGEALLSLFKGRTTYTLSRMSRASRYRKQSKYDITERQQDIAEVEDNMEKAEQEFQVFLQQTNDKWAKTAADVQEYVITSFKKDIQVEIFGIGWIPYWYADINGQQLMLPAYA